MNVLDLFSGLKGWSQPFIDRGHDVITVDIEAKFKPTIQANVIGLTSKDFETYGRFDVVLASPPCNCFSVASVYRHWDKDTKRPKDQETYEAIKLVGHTVKLILSLAPRYWLLENPRGMLRYVLGPPAITTFFASWGHWALKATDIWGVLPEGIQWKKPKKWIKAPRGFHTGIQGNVKKAWPSDMTHKVRKPALRAKIPYELGEAVCLACESSIY